METVHRQIKRVEFDYRKEVEPFVRNPEALDIWSRDFFRDVAARIKPE